MGIQINGTTDTISAVDGSLDINQNATFGNNVTIGGTLTYSDVTNIDSVGLVTAKNGLRIHAGGIDLTSGISTFSDNIQIADKIIHKDDTNNAIRFPTADTFAVETAGSERLRIASTGRVGINTNNPGSNLTVWANDSVTDTDVFQVRSKTGALNIQVSDSDASNPEWAIRTYSSEPIVFKQATVERMRIGSSGDVGIGTNNPQYALDISDGAHSGIRIGVATHAYRIRTNVSTTNDYGFYIEDEEGTDLYNVRGPHSTTDPNIHKFYTGATERLRIQSTGKVIIGTGTRNAETSTGALLLDRDITAESDAGDPNNYHLVIRSQTNSNTSKLGIGFVNTTDDTKLGAAILHHRTAGASVGDLAFYTSPSDGTINERLRIDKDGRVAIGTDGYGNVAPLAPLHVSSYSPTTAVTDHNTLRGASQLVLQTSNNINDSRSGLMFSGALHSTDGCSAGIIANHENVAENSEQTSLSFYTSHSETLGERLRISSNGYVTKPNTPYFHVQASPSITNTPYDNGLKQFGTINSNNGSHYDNSTGVFTCPVAGYYFFTASLWSANGDQNNGDTYALIYRRDSNGNNGVQIAGANHHDQWDNLMMAVGYYCASGDKIYVFYNGSVQGSTPRNYFSGCLIG